MSGVVFSIALGRALREVRAKDLPIVPREVLRAIADRADADGLAWPALGTIAQEAGTTVPTVRRSLARLERDGRLHITAGTSRESARYRLTVDPLPQTERSDHYRSARVNAASRLSKRSVVADGTERSSRLNAALPEGNKKDHREAHREAPISPAQARVRGDRPSPVQASLPLGVSSGQETLPPKPKRTKRAPGEAKAEDLYAAAYVSGHEDAGFPMTVLNASERGMLGMLGMVAAAHAKYRDGTLIVGAELVQWFRLRAREFREDLPDATHHPGKYSPFGFGKWLDAGADGKLRLLAPGQREPAPEVTQSRPVPPEKRTWSKAYENETARMHGLPPPHAVAEGPANG